MEEDEEIFFIINTPQFPPSRGSNEYPSTSVGASYIRDWQVEGACAQLYLSKLQFNEFKEYGSNNNLKSQSDSIRKYSPPKFRYKYLKGRIVLYLLHNGQIFIPLEALSGIEKLKSKAVKLILKEGKKNLIEYNWNDSYTHGKKVVIKENMRAAQHIFLKFHHDVFTKEIDIVGLHIDYLINKNNSGTSDPDVPRSSWISSWGLFKKNESNNDNEMVIKFHINNEIRIFLFDNSSQLQEIKEQIEEACNLSTIRKLKCKDDNDKFIIISSQEEFETAFILYSKNNRFEMWC